MTRTVLCSATATATDYYSLFVLLPLPTKREKEKIWNLKPVIYIIVAYHIASRLENKGMNVTLNYHGVQFTRFEQP